MSIAPLINLASGYIQSLFSNPASASSSGGSSMIGSGIAQDANQPGSFAQILSSLQQLQQSSPIQYQTVTHQISSNLQTAAQSAAASGDTALANQLNQLSTDFNGASTSSQLPNVKDLAQAVGMGGHHHHHHGGALSSASASSSGSNVSEFLQSIGASQTGSNGNTSPSAFSIIDNTLSSVGL
jgi:hypothetical protein